MYTVSGSAWSGSIVHSCFLRNVADEAFILNPNVSAVKYFPEALTRPIFIWTPASEFAAAVPRDPFIADFLAVLNIHHVDEKTSGMTASQWIRSRTKLSRVCVSFRTSSSLLVKPMCRVDLKTE